MRKFKQIEIKNRTYYFQIFRISLVKKINKKHYKGTDTYYIGYIAIKRIGDCENIQCKSFVFAY